MNDFNNIRLDKISEVDIPAIDQPKKQFRVSTYEGFCLRYYKEGESFLTILDDTAVVSAAYYYKRKVQTEKMILIKPSDGTSSWVTRVTIKK